MELKSGDLFFCKKFLWEVKNQRGDQRIKWRKQKREKK